MMDWLAAAYPWIKSLHVISAISWMAGMLYLPRLFVYHAVAAPGSAQAETFQVMERRLLRAIMNPAMIGTWLFGGMLLFTPGIVDWAAGWIYAKLGAVAGMTVAHHVFALWGKEFERGEVRRPQRIYRIANEIPAVLMIVVVVMVIARPF
jgi:putative membrane protein